MRATLAAAALAATAVFVAGAALSQGTKSDAPAQAPQAQPPAQAQPAPMPQMPQAPQMPRAQAPSAPGSKAPQQQALPDWRAQPRYATLNLQVGFEPDPREVAVEAGGDREATAVRPDCLGWIDFSRPDVDLNYAPGQGSYPLYISAVANVDTTIVVNDPAGAWHCNDDFEGLNPGLVFQRPLMGNYNIWIGTLDRTAPQRATVRISEVPPQRR
jgi:serine protease Do